MAEALSAAQSLFSGAFALVKGMKQPTLPRKTTFARVNGVTLPRSHHTVSVVKGRAYIFGGEDAPGHFADNSMHIVNLPSDLMAADYQSIPPRPAKKDDQVPAPRKNHSAAVVGDHIYIFGGQLELETEEPQARLWVFSTYMRTWSHMDPTPGTAFPRSRYQHTSTGSEEPEAELAPPKQNILPQQPPDPAKNLSEPPPPNSWGTVFISGGRAVQKEGEGEGKLLDDTWMFDIRNRRWFNLPDPPGDGRMGTSLAIAGERIYLFGGRGGPNERFDGSMDWVDVGAVWKYGLKGNALDDLAKSSLIGDWQTAAPDNKPGGRIGAGLVDVTIGQGRRYLLLIAGDSSVDSDRFTFSDEVWLYQLPSAKVSAAGVKDSARAAANHANQEGAWAEVIYQYLNADGDVVQEQTADAPTTKGMGARGYFGSARGTEVDGATAVVWGGIGDDGKVLNDGWMITVD